MQTITDGKHVFEIVDSVPYGYMIWNIGKNMIDGYLPLCRLKAVQRFEGGRDIETGTLKAIKIDGAQTILAAVGYGPDTLESMERYIKQHSKTKKSFEADAVKRMKAAVEIMRTIKWN